MMEVVPIQYNDSYDEPEEYTKRTKLLIKSGNCTQSECDFELIRACQLGYVTSVRLLLADDDKLSKGKCRYSADPGAFDNKAIRVAVLSGNFEVVDALLDDYRTDRSVDDNQLYHLARALQDLARTHSELVFHVNFGSGDKRMDARFGCMLHSTPGGFDIMLGGACKAANHRMAAGMILHRADFGGDAAHSFKVVR